MSGGKKQSVPEIFKESVGEVNFITRFLVNLWDSYFGKDNRYLKYIDKNGIKWTALEKELNRRNVENLDYAIAEIKGLYGSIQNIDETLADCRYNDEILCKHLWGLYCQGKSNDKIIECEKSIKDVLYITVKLKIQYKKESDKFNQEISLRSLDKSMEIADNQRRLEKKLDAQIIQRKGSQKDTYEEKREEIKIYLAASQNECRDYIEAFKCFVEKLNTKLEEDGIYIALFQGESNLREEIIQNCNYYYVIVKTVAEDWMKKSYEIAYDQYRSTKFPKIHFWVKKLSDSELNQVHKSRTEFRGRYIEDFGEAPMEFEDMDSVRLDIILSNLGLMKFNGLQLEEDFVRVDHDICFSLDSIPQFRNSEAFCRERKEQAILEDKFDRAREDYHNNRNAGTREELEKAKKELEMQTENVSRLKWDIWSNMMLLAEKSQNNGEMDRRERKAIECINEHNDYETANFILDSPEWRTDINILSQRIENEKDKESRNVVNYISGQKTLISNLKINGVTRDLEIKIYNIYKHITELSQKWQIEYNTLYEFAEFLLYQRNYAEGIKQANRLLLIDELDNIISSEDKAKLFNLLGQLYFWRTDYAQADAYYEQAKKIMEKEPLTSQLTKQILENDLKLAQLFWKTNQFVKADKKFKDLLIIIELMAQREPEKYQQMLGEIYSYIAILSNKRKQFDIAIEYHNKALKLRERLVAQNLSNEKGELRDLVNTYNNLGVIYKKLGDYEKSIEYHEKSLDICRKKVEENPNVYRPTIALGYTNLAASLSMNGETKRAQEVCQKALDIRRELNSEDSSYNAVVAKTLCEYGVILGYGNNYPKAEECFQEAIMINKDLAVKDRTAHEPTLAKVYFHYGRFLTSKGKGKTAQDNDRAEEYLNKALEVFRRFDKDNPEYYVFEMAETCETLATVLYRSQKKRFQAECLCRESMEYWKNLVPKCPQVFGPKYENAKMLLAQLTDNIPVTT